MENDYSEPVLITLQWEISVCDNNTLQLTQYVLGLERAVISGLILSILFQWISSLAPWLVASYEPTAVQGGCLSCKFLGHFLPRSAVSKTVQTHEFGDCVLIELNVSELS
jgi:hypothetical protein